MIEEFKMLLHVVYIFTKSIFLCLVVELFLSSFQNKSFRFKRGFCLWGLYFFGGSLVGNFVANIGNFYDERHVTARQQASFLIKEFRINHGLPENLPEGKTPVSDMFRKKKSPPRLEIDDSS